MIEIQDGVTEVRKEMVYQQNYKSLYLVIYYTLSQSKLVVMKLKSL